MSLCFEVFAILLFWKCLAIMLAGGLGSLLRYAVTEALEHFVGKSFPWGTMLVNLLGCFVFGILWALFTKGQLNDDQRLILLVGFLGGFTTFSSFGFHNEEMLTHAQWGQLLANVLIQNIVGIAAVWLGIRLAS